MRKIDRNAGGVLILVDAEGRQRIIFRMMSFWWRQHNRLSAELCCVGYSLLDNRRGRPYNALMFYFLREMD